MSKEKRERANLLDPTRFKIAHQNAMPNGAQNNAPDPVVQSSGAPIEGKSIYNDYAQKYPQMGSAILNPINVGPSGLQQNFPMGLKNNSMPFGIQQQPPSSQGSKAWEGMEATRLNDELKNRGLPTGSYLGLSGMPAQPAPGAFPSNFPGSSGPPLMQGTQAAGEMAPENSMNGKTPGSTPTKINKPKRA